jgi:anti-sigma B factor antagonist
VETATTTLRVEGELDIATAGRLRREVGALLGTGCRHLVVDLSDTEFMDSSGLGALVWAAHRLHAAGGDLVAVNPSAAVARTLEITGVDRLLALA